MNSPKQAWMDEYLAYLKDYAATHPHFCGDEVIAAFRRDYPRKEPLEKKWYGQAAGAGKRNKWYSKLMLTRPKKCRNHIQFVTLWRSHLYPHRSDKYNLNAQKNALRKQAITEGLLVSEVIERAVLLGLHYREPAT
jgi:hypothetical protein